MGKTSSSSQSTSYVTAQGAGAISSASTTSPSGETSSRQTAVFTPGATSSQASASALSVDGVTVTATAPAEDGAARTTLTSEDTQPAIEHPPNLVLHIGSPFNELLNNTDQQDVMPGYTGVDIFELSYDSQEIYTATIDIIINFDLNEDFLQLSDDISASELSFELGDIDADTVPDSTVIRLGEDGDILAVVLNTILPISSEQTATIDTSSHSSSQSFVNESGAGTISEAIATSPTGETSRSIDSIFVPEATSSGGSSNAIATSDPVATTTVSVPADAQPATIENPLAIDFLLGTPMADRLVSTPDRDIFVGYGEGDIFVLDAAGTEHLAQADLIIDFNQAQGDMLQLSAGLSLETDIVLEPVDLDNNGILESTSVRLTNGNILAIAYGVDLLSTLPIAAVITVE